MIKILNLTHKNVFPFLKPIFKFSTNSDPYYILGVDKGSEFIDIKKAFYKLANQYHPDKNNSADAGKKFLLVKQAFEQIKIEKGLMKAQNFIDTVSHDSVRPNADQFSPDEQESYRSTRDYRIFRQKAGSDEKYSQFNSSFQTIHDMNDIKIKVEEGKMKDASERFNLESMRAKITVRSQNSMTIVVIGMAGLFFILTFLDDWLFGEQQKNLTNQIIEKSQESKKMTIESNESMNRKIQVESDKKIKQAQLMEIISQKSGKKDDNEKSKLKSDGISQRVAWSKLVEETKQDFIMSSEKVL